MIRGGKSIAFNLANFNLRVNGYRLLMTTTDKESLDAIRENFVSLNPYKQYRTENFAVKVLSRDRDANVKKWQKISGFSFWEPVVEATNK